MRLPPALRLLAPALQASAWREQQIEALDPARSFFLGLAGSALARRDRRGQYLAIATLHTPSLLVVRVAAQAEM